MAVTTARVQTFARFDLLEQQVLTMLRQTTGVSQSILDRVSLGIHDPHYIDTIIVVGIYPHGTIGAELRLHIDWRLNSLEMKAGGTAIQAPSSWHNGIAPSIDEGVRTFLRACSLAGLSQQLQVLYQPHFDVNEVRRILGFVAADKRSWERTPYSSDQLVLGPLRVNVQVVGWPARAAAWPG